MKRATLKMMSATLMLCLFALTACAEKDQMAMEKMDKSHMKTEMKDDAKMMMDDKAHEMSKKMDGEMAEPMKESMKKEMDTMKKDMDASMDGEMKKME